MNFYEFSFLFIENNSYLLLLNLLTFENYEGDFN